MLRQTLRRFPHVAEDRGGWPAEPFFQEGGVNAAEVRVKLDVAVVEVVEAGVLADETGLYLAADEEDRGGGAVVGAAAGVFLQPSSELTENKGHHPVKLSMAGEVLGEGGERPADLVEQAGVGSGLVRVRIEAV